MTRRISYQSILADRAAGAGGTRYVPLAADAIATRRRDASARIEVRVSKAQRRWLREVREVSDESIDESAIVRALIDLGRALPIDWPLVSGGGALRRAVRESVAIRADDSPKGE
jgi:hypothetical protein